MILFETRFLVARRRNPSTIATALGGGLQDSGPGQTLGSARSIGRGPGLLGEETGVRSARGADRRGDGASGERHCQPWRAARRRILRRTLVALRATDRRAPRADRQPFEPTVARSYSRPRQQSRLPGSISAALARGGNVRQDLNFQLWLLDLLRRGRAGSWQERSSYGASPSRSRLPPRQPAQQ